MEIVTISRAVPHRYVSGVATGNLYGEAKYMKPVSFNEYEKKGIGFVLMGPGNFDRTLTAATLHGYAHYHRDWWGLKEGIWSNARDVAYQYAPGMVDEVFGESCLDIYSKCRWLVVDCLGTETDYKNHQHRMADLLRRRVDNGVCTSFTTSLNQQQIINIYGDDFWGKMKEGCLILSKKDKS